MTFWIILAALTLSLIAWIAWPLLRPRTGDMARTGYDATVYYDQLQELERDRARGLIDDTQSEAARGEIERRLLAAGRAAGMSRNPRVRRHLVLATVLAILVPVASIPLYLDLGSPGLPNLPFAAREAPPQATPEAGSTWAGCASSPATPMAPRSRWRAPVHSTRQARKSHLPMVNHWRASPTDRSHRPRARPSKRHSRATGPTPGPGIFWRSPITRPAARRTRSKPGRRSPVTPPPTPRGWQQSAPG